MSYRVSKAWHVSHELAHELHELVREVVPTDQVAIELAQHLRRASSAAPHHLEISIKKELQREKQLCYREAQFALKEVYTYLAKAHELAYIDKQLFDKLTDLTAIAHDELQAVAKTA